jgi:hypothetical protein
MVDYEIEHFRKECSHCGGTAEEVSYSVVRCKSCKAVWGIKWI